MNLIMDCNETETTTNNISRHSDLGDDSAISNDDHSDEHDDMRDCDSIESDGVNLNNSVTSSTAMEYAADGRSPEPNSELSMNHHNQFPPNHPFGALGNFMGMAGLHNLPNLPHGDVLEKLKMQVRDMKVGLMDQEYPSHHNSFGSNNSLNTPVNTAFTLPATSANSFSHSPQNLSQTHSQSLHHQQPAQQQQSMSNGFSFASPNAPSLKDVNPASNSSTSSEASNSSQQNNGWSFEEQYKQVRQLYEINDDPKRKEFLDDLFSFMQKRGSPINRLPIMAKSVLDLYELYNLVIARGGLVDVINKKLWQEIIKGLHLPSSITSAAFTLRTQYMKYLYPYECEKKNLSTPAELQAAIDGNRREGRRSSYGQFEAAMHNQMQMPQMPRNNVPGSIQQMSPLALVTHTNAQAAAAAAHHRLMAPTFGQVPNLVTHELEQRMMEYLKLIQGQKEQPRPRSQSPEITTREALNALEMSRVALWQMYHNNPSPPASVNTSPQGVEPQREALNLSDSPPNITIKRERDEQPLADDREDFHQPPPAKRGIANNFLLPTPANSNSFHEEDDEHDDDIDDHGANLSHDNDDMMNGDDKMQQSRNHHSVNNNKSPLFNSSSSPSKSHHPASDISAGELSLLSGMQFKVTRKANGANGEQQLVVNLELNGVKYEGVLIATPTNETTSPSEPIQSPSMGHHTVTSPPTITTSSTESTSALDERTTTRSLVSS